MAFNTQTVRENVEKEIENGKQLVEFAMAGDLEGIRRLLDSGVSVNAEAYNRSLFYKSLNYVTPLQCAAGQGHAKCVELLISSDAELDACDRFDVTAVHMAAENGHLQCLQMLLDAGASCNVSTKYSKHGSYTATPHVGGTTALHLATKSNHIRCVRELILNGADYNAADELGRTSLYIAAKQGLQECVLMHLRNAVGRDILSLPLKESGETPLHETVRQAMLPSVSELLKHGSSVNHRNQAGFSPLHLAVQNSEWFSFDIVRELVRNGYNTDVNLMDSTGTIPLQYLVFGDNPRQERRPAVAAFLIAYGAKFKHLKNKHGSRLLQQELRSFQPDDSILKAMVRSMVRLPSLESMDIGYPRQMNRLNPVPAEKCKWYQSIRTNPRPLQHYARCSIRKTLGTARLKHIPKLPLPRPLMEYLLLEFEDFH